MNKLIRLLGSKTVIGAAGACLTWLASLPVIDVKHVVGAISITTVAAGVRDALHKIEEASKPKGGE